MTNVAVLSLEVLVAGITAMVWIVLIIVRILFPDDQVEATLFAIVNSISVGNLLISSILIYNIGWVIHHIAEKLLDPIFQTRYRRKLFDDKEFYKIRTKVFQEGSPCTMDDIKFDRHILRISRSNILNFLALAIVSLSYFSVNQQVFMIIFVCSLLVVLVSVSQWHSRYIGTFKKFKDIYSVIIENESKATNFEIESVSKGKNKKSRIKQGSLRLRSVSSPTEHNKQVVE